MPLCGEINLCPKINIDKFVCCKARQIEEHTESDFRLIQRKQKRYKNFIPYDEKYLYLKVLYNGKILCYSGQGLDLIFGICNNCIGKTLSDAKKCNILFREYVFPIFNECIKDGQIYQFDFEFFGEEYSCCFYPCMLPYESSTVDIVIRLSQQMSSEQIKNFIVKPLEREASLDSDNIGAKEDSDDSDTSGKYRDAI